MFDFTINLGIILQTVATLAVIAGYVTKIHFDLKLLIQSHLLQGNKITNIEARLEEINKIVVEIARQDQRLNNLETRLQEVSNRVYNALKLATD